MEHTEAEKLRQKNVIFPLKTVEFDSAGEPQQTKRNQYNFQSQVILKSEFT